MKTGTSGFRQFTKEIVGDKQSFPTFDDFKKDFTQNKDSQLKIKAKQSQSNQISQLKLGGNGGKINVEQSTDESAYWEKYFTDLQEKTKMQRQKIKQYDLKKQKEREQILNFGIESRLVHKLQQKKMQEQQRSTTSGTSNKPFSVQNNYKYQEINTQAQKSNNRKYIINNNNNDLPPINQHNYVPNRQRGGTNTSYQTARKDQLTQSMDRQRKMRNRTKEANITVIDNQYQKSVSDQDSDQEGDGHNPPIREVNDEGAFYLTSIKQQKRSSLSYNKHSSQISKGLSGLNAPQNEEQMFEQFKLNEFLQQIKLCKEKDQPITIKGFGFNNCPYAKLIEQEQEDKKKNKKDQYHDSLIVQKNFLKAQSKGKDNEHKLFDKLKEELDKAQMEEVLIQKQSISKLPSDKNAIYQNSQIFADPIKKILRDITELNKRGIDQSVNLNYSSQQNGYGGNRRYQTNQSHISVQGGNKQSYRETGMSYSPKFTGQALFNLNVSLGQASLKNSMKL